MVKLDIYGGLLGTGKTTLIRQMLATAYAGHKTAVIENGIGKVNLDAELLKKASISVREISSGCICCTVKGSFTEAVKMLVEQEDPDYIVVEPSGVADLAGERISENDGRPHPKDGCGVRRPVPGGAGRL